MKPEPKNVVNVTTYIYEKLIIILAAIGKLSKWRWIEIDMKITVYGDTQVIQKHRIIDRITHNEKV